jgi:hypothetical protein
MLDNHDGGDTLWRNPRLSRFDDSVTGAQVMSRECEECAMPPWKPRQRLKHPLRPLAQCTTPSAARLTVSTHQMVGIAKDRPGPERGYQDNKSGASGSTH